uniref:DAGKc domain-containing protein n=1 Tax=Pseudo-nitzschia australis TaxID=44445 RepID=A0A7S4EE35_9STRA|mmetsp:Transcript_8071/g.17388  ORF Transcript_8071/g.17388 Transcript_8071/m.17388 type:complete len:603 (+) Transcript_8071:83-1891(+)
MTPDIVDEDNVEWPREEAERVKLFLPKDGDPYQGMFRSSEQTTERRCVFRFDEDRQLLRVEDETAEESVVLDIIDPDDIIGVNVEVKLVANRKASERRSIGGSTRSIANIDSDKSTLSGTDEDERGKISPTNHGSTTAANNEPHSEVPIDTQAKAVLSLFVYPKRKTLAKGSILRFCRAEQNNNNSKTTSTKAEVAFNAGEIDRQEDNSSSPGHRYAHHRQFIVAPSEDFTDLSILVNAIRKLSRRILTKETEGSLRDEEERLLVIINPYSGGKLGVREYDTIVLPMLEQAGIAHDCLVTTHSRHAEERMKKQSSTSDFKDISEYSGIVLVGGDGIIHEVMQGIHHRSDRDKILKKIKLGAIGAGTSNGFSASLAHASKENFSPLDSVFMIAKGISFWIDLSLYETKSNTYTSFLTFSWAMIADIDIESESIRWTGFLRMDIWGIVRVLFLRKYRARFSYLPPTGERKAITMPPLGDPLPDSQGWISCEDEFIVFWASQVTHGGEQMFHAPPCKLNDGMFQIMIVRGNVSRLRLGLILLSMEHGGHFGMSGVEFIECSAYRLEPISRGSYNDLDGEVIESGPIQAAVLPSSIRAYCTPQYST